MDGLGTTAAEEERNEESGIEQAGVGMTREEAFATAKVIVRDLFDAMNEMKARARRGDTAVIKEMRAPLGEISKALVLLGHTENKIDDLERAANDGRPEPIDLDAARDEIGRRLDRLRAAGGP